MALSNGVSARVTWRALAVAVLVGLAGCGGRTADPFSSEQSGAIRIRVHVENQNFDDFRLFAVTSRGPLFLGQVAGMTSRTFTVDWRGLDEIRVRMESLTSSNFESNPVTASPSDQLELTIPREGRVAYLRRR
jgi:hypothetical protein